MKIEINIPEGYEIDKENSTWDNILLKEKVKYKTGDWVKVRDKILKIDSSHLDGRDSYFYVEGYFNPRLYPKDIERLATEQEIKETEWKPGELYWVKLNSACGWELRFASKEYGQFYINQNKSGECQTWKEFQLAEGVSLPS